MNIFISPDVTDDQRQPRSSLVRYCDRTQAVCVAAPDLLSAAPSEKQ
jgi:hypothetical protein